MCGQCQSSIKFGNAGALSVGSLITASPACHVDARLLGFSKELFQGFVMVVDMKGTVVYASENITEQLGPQLVSVCRKVTGNWALALRFLLGQSLTR